MRSPLPDSPNGFIHVSLPPLSTRTIICISPNKIPSMPSSLAYAHPRSQLTFCCHIQSFWRNSTATVTITIDRHAPDSLFYNLSPLYETDLPPVKEQIAFDTEVFDNNKISSRQEIIENLIPYVKNEIKKGTRLNQIMRHTIGLFHGQTGSNFWKRYLSENMCVRDADVKKIDHIMDKVRLSPKLHSAGRID